MPVKVAVHIPIAEVFHCNEEGLAVFVPPVRPDEASVVLEVVRTKSRAITSMPTGCRVDGTFAWENFMMVSSSLR